MSNVPLLKIINCKELKNGRSKSKKKWQVTLNDETKNTTNRNYQYTRG